jgi:hypothetical protein
MRHRIGSQSVVMLITALLLITVTGCVGEGDERAASPAAGAENPSGALTKDQVMEAINARYALNEGHWGAGVPNNGYVVMMCEAVAIESGQHGAGGIADGRVRIRIWCEEGGDVVSGLLFESSSPFPVDGGAYPDPQPFIPQISEALSFCASIPFNGEDSQEAAQWVANGVNAESAANPGEQSIVIDGRTLFLKSYGRRGSFKLSVSWPNGPELP